MKFGKLEKNDYIRKERLANETLSDLPGIKEVKKYFNEHPGAKKILKDSVWEGAKIITDKALPGWKAGGTIAMKLANAVVKQFAKEAVYPSYGFNSGGAQDRYSYRAKSYDNRRFY